MAQIKVTVSPVGDVVVETSGFKGKSCQEATAQLEKALGTPGNSKKKPEFYGTASTGLDAQA